MEERLQLAVFIDFDNIEIGVKTTTSTELDLSLILEALKERGEVVSKSAYGDWARAGMHSRTLTDHAVDHPHQALGAAGVRTRRKHGGAPTLPPLEIGRHVVAESVALAHRLEEHAVGIGADQIECDLEREKVAVAGTFTASSPSDPFAALSGLMHHPRPGLDAAWLNTIVALSVFAFEHYHDEQDLAKSVLAPDAYDGLRSIYERSYDGPEGLVARLAAFGGRPLLGYFRAEYRDPAYFAASRYGQLLAEAETYRQLFRSPVRAYYGTRDEVVKEMIGRLSAAYQGIMIGDDSDPALNPVVAEAVPGADHRRTFITAAPAAKAWMDGIRKHASDR